MYGSQTYEVILQRCLDRVPSDIDKAQGSIIYDALAPACAEIAQIYIEIDNQLKQSFADTATGEFLTKRCAEFGVNRYPATRSIRKGVFTGALPDVGARFGLNELTYVVINNSGGLSNTQLRCEQFGAVGNRDSGSILPITNLVGLQTATLSDIIVYGEDEENDADLYARFKNALNNPIYSANVNQYKLWAESVAGVGASNVIPTWNGANTVKVVIVDANKEGATTTLVSNVQDYIDPNQTGDGEGVAPIGAIVTVVSADEIDIDVTATLTIEPSANLSTIKTLFETALKNYLKTIALTTNNTVRYSQIASIILDTAGVVDYASLTVNGGTANITIANDEVGVLGTTTFTT